MKNPVSLLHDTILPPAQKRWSEYHESNGMPSASDLYLEHEREHLSTERIIDHTGTDIGEKQTYRYRFNQGDRHEARAYRLDKPYQSPMPIVQLSDLPFLTLLDGLPDYWASRDARLTGLDRIVVGSNHGSNEPFRWHDFARLPSTFEQGLKASLARTAFKSEVIANDLQDHLDLPKEVIIRGKSQSSVLAPAHYGAAPLVKNRIIYSDSEAPVMHERLFTHPADIPRLGAWMTVESISIAALIAKAVKDGTLDRLRGTTNLHPNFVLSNLVGGIPSLTSGEFEHTVGWMPTDSPAHFTVFKLDLLSRLDVIRGQLANHPNVYVPTPDKWLTHNSGLTDEEVMDEGSMRVNAIQDLIHEKPNIEDRTTVDYQQIFEMEDGMGYPFPHAA